MKILLTADLHGLPAAYERFAALLVDRDAGVIAGDLADYSPEPGEREAALKKILLGAGRPVFFIMGNDDVSEWRDEGPLRNVNQRRVPLGGFNVVGYQYTLPFVGSVFEKDEGAQASDFLPLGRLVDENTILVTHGPAYSVLDAVRGAPFWDGGKLNLNTDNQPIPVGSRALKRFVDEHPVWLHLFGHVHQSFGVLGNSINAAFAHSKEFVEIELETRTVRAVPTGIGEDRGS